MRVNVGIYCKTKKFLYQRHDDTCLFHLQKVKTTENNEKERKKLDFCHLLVKNLKISVRNCIVSSQS